jgi:hypothetical protein
VVAVDPAGHDARRRAQESERFVRATRSDAAGLRMLCARTTAGDVARLDAMIGHLAQLLAAAGDDDDLQRRRAKALGLLANPALACVYLADHRPALDPVSAPRVAAESPEGGVASEVESEQEHTAEPVAAARVLGEALRSLGAAVVARLRPRAVLYLHLAEEAVAGTPQERRPASQVVRTEGLGAATREQLREWLGTDPVVVTPVIDLHGQEPVDAYEVPHHLRDAMVLAHPFEVFPWGTTAARARSVDADHTRPWTSTDDGGPPGQTRLDNLGPLARGHHRAKTFGGFVCHQPLPGLYLWRTPTGHWFRVDHTGTTALGRRIPDLVRQQERQERPTPATVGERHVDRSHGEGALMTLLGQRAA